MIFPLKRITAVPIDVWVVEEYSIDFHLENLAGKSYWTIGFRKLTVRRL